MLPFYCAHPRTAAKVTNDRSVAIGLDAPATNQGVVAIGDDAEGTTSHAIAIGTGTRTTASGGDRGAIAIGHRGERPRLFFVCLSLGGRGTGFLHARTIIGATVHSTSAPRVF